MPKFKIGDIVRVVEVDEDDIPFGIQIGDTFKVIEEDTMPYCVPVNSPKYKFGFEQVSKIFYEEQLELANNPNDTKQQLELVVDPIQQEINELNILLSTQDKEIARLNEIIENQKQELLKHSNMVNLDDYNAVILSGKITNLNYVKIYNHGIELKNVHRVEYKNSLDEIPILITEQLVI